MDQIDYASRFTKCKETFSSNPLRRSQLTTRSQEEREQFIEEQCRQSVNSQMEKEKTQKQQQTQIEETKNKLPTSKDAELVKKQIEAEMQKKKGELENKLQQEKEKKVEELKDKVATLASLALGSSSSKGKLPIIDPKIRFMINFLKSQKELNEKKQVQSKENLKKAKENFTYTIKPSSKS